VKVAVLRFPGSNCDQDALYSLRDMGLGAEYVWHADNTLSGFDAVFVPGGFSYGDYLRCGAMASRARIMEEVIRFANDGGPVIGVCNGFQILTETNLLPGALLLNEDEQFLCQDVYLQSVNSTSIWTQGVDRIIRIPIAHGEGRYVCDAETLKQIEGNGQVAFRYVTETGEQTAEANPNGSTNAIAGVLNEKGNVLGLMPHPERASTGITGNSDGLTILNALRLLNV